MDLLDIHDSNISSFTSILESFGLNQIINSPTRITEISASLIDFIIISEERKFSDSGALSLINISDHELVFGHLLFYLPRNVEILTSYRNIKNIDVELIYDHVRSIPWKNIYDTDNIDIELINIQIISNV